MDPSRLTVFSYVENGHEIEAQEEQVHQVVVSDSVRGQMGMDAAQAFQADAAGPDPGEGGNDDLSLVTDDDEGYATGPVDQDAYLAADVSGESAEGPGNLGGDNGIRIHALLGQFFKIFELRCFQAGCVAD